MQQLDTDKLDSPAGDHFSSTPLSVGALVSVIALHGALLGLLMHAPISTAKHEQPTPFMVSLLTAPVAVEPEEPVQIEPLPQPAPPIQAEPKPEVAPEIKPEPVAVPVREPEPEIRSGPKAEIAPEPKPEPRKVAKRAPKPAKVAKEKPPVPSPAEPLVQETSTEAEFPSVADAAPPGSAAPPAAAAEPEPVELALAAPQPATPPAPAGEPVSDYNPPRFSAAYLSNPPPVYPRLSRRMGEQGKVLLRVLVSDDGSSKKVEIESSSGSSRLDQAASEAVASWRFVPARRGEQAIAAWVVVPIVFSLEG